MKNSRPKVLCLHVLYAQPRVIQHSLVRIKDFPIRVHNVDRLGYGIHNPAKLHLVLPELFFRALMLDGNCRQRSDLFKDIQVLWTRTARLAIVHREGPQHLAFGGNDRRGPAGSQSVRQGQMTIIGPQRVHGDVRDDHRRGAVSGCDARSAVRTNGHAVGRCDGTVRQGGVRRRIAGGVRSSSRKNEDTTSPHCLRSGGIRLQDFGGAHRLWHHLQDAFLSRQQRLAPGRACGAGFWSSMLERFHAIGRSGLIVGHLPARNGRLSIDVKMA